MKAELVINENMQLGESSLWDDRRKLLWCVDITGKTIHSYDPKTQEHLTYDAGQVIADMVTCGDGFMLALLDGMNYWEPGMEHPEFATVPEDMIKLPNGRFNDGKCDAKGRLFMGTVSMQPQKACLYRFEDGKGWAHAIDGVTISNGLIWNNANTALYYIDTPTLEVWKYDFDLETGELGNKTTVIRFAEEDGTPDGMTIDANDNLWIAHWGGFCVGCWDPSTGKCLDRVQVPARNVSSCTFGGEELSTLYITTATDYTPISDAEDYPLSGCVFKAETGVKGTVFNDCVFTRG